MLAIPGLKPVQPRYENGRKKVSRAREKRTVDRLNEANARDMRAEKSTALSNPERSRFGARAEEASTPLRRLCIARGLREECLRAGEMFFECWARWRLSVGMTVEGYAGEPGNGGIEELSRAEVDALRQRYESARRALRETGEGSAIAVWILAIDRRDGPEDYEQAAVLGLMALVDHFGMRPRNIREGD